MQQTQVLVDDAAVNELSAGFGGTILRDGDRGYEASRSNGRWR